MQDHRRSHHGHRVRLGRTSLFVFTAVIVWAAQICHTLADLLTKDYCSYDTFNATCGPQEVIMFESARYGRMKMGSCVKRDMGHVGCAADVTSVLDGACSGRRHCLISVNDQRLRQSEPCPSELTWYLEATYRCITVTIIESSANCHRLGHTIPKSVVSAPTGFLMSPLEPGVPHRKPCAWSLVVRPGQTLRLNLINLATLGTHMQENICVDFGHVEENGKAIPLTSCGDELQSRVRQIYLSESNDVRIQLRRQQNLFMLEYAAVGCADMTLGGEFHTHRRGGKMMVHCNKTEETWYMVCQDTRWVGNVGNCTGSATSYEPTYADGGGILANDTFPYGLVIAVASGVALGVFLGGLSLAAFSAYLKRRQRQGMRNLKQSQSAVSSPGCHSGGQIYIPRADVAGEWIRLGTSDYGSSQQTECSTASTFCDKDSGLGKPHVIRTPSGHNMLSAYHTYEKPSSTSA